METKTKPLDCYIRGIKTEGVTRTITAAEHGLKDRAPASRADTFKGSAVPLNERTDARRK
jgi:hypothetical protein